MARLDHPGVFLAQPYRWAVRKGTDTAAIGVTVGYIVQVEYPPGEPEIDLAEHPWEVDGYINIVKGDGQDNERQIRVLVSILEWDGLFSTFGVDEHNQVRWHPPMCRITVEEQEFKGCKSLRVNRVDRADGCPLGSAPDDLADLDQARPDMAAKAARYRTGKPAAAPASPPPTPGSMDTIPF